MPNNLLKKALSLSLKGLAERILKSVERKYGQTKFYAEYKDLISHLVYKPLYYLSICGCSGLLIYVYNNTPDLVVFPIRFINPRFLGSINIWSRQPDSPPLVFPQYKYFPVEYAKKDEFVYDVFIDLCRQQKKTYLFEPTNRRFEDDLVWINQHLTLASFDAMNNGNVSNMIGMVEEKGIGLPPNGQLEPNEIRPRDKLRKEHFDKISQSERKKAMEAQNGIGIIPVIKRNL